MKLWEGTKIFREERKKKKREKEKEKENCREGQDQDFHSFIPELLTEHLLEESPRPYPQEYSSKGDDNKHMNK